MAERGLPIKVKLPLLIGGLLVAVTGIYSWAAREKILPAAMTFYWNGDGTVVGESGRCSIEPGHPSFE